MTNIDATPGPAPTAQVGQLRHVLNVLQPVVIMSGLLDALIGVADVSRSLDCAGTLSCRLWSQ
jgi:hypothetical protein